MMGPLIPSFHPKFQPFFYRSLIYPLGFGFLCLQFANQRYWTLHKMRLPYYKVGQCSKLTIRQTRDIIDSEFPTYRFETLNQWLLKKKKKKLWIDDVPCLNSEIRIFHPKFQPYNFFYKSLIYAVGFRFLCLQFANQRYWNLHEMRLPNYGVEQC